MSAQSSYFMVWGAKESRFEEMFSDEKYHMCLPQKDSNVRSYGQHEQEALLFSFLIYADRKQPLLRELDMVGINEKTLFPGLCVRHRNCAAKPAKLSKDSAEIEQRFRAN